MASTLTVDNIVGATSASKVHVPGGVVQVVSTSKTDAYTATVNTPTLVMAVTITPKYSNSKILVTASVQACTGTGSRAFIQLRKNNAVLTQGDASGNRRRCHAQISNMDVGFMESISMEHLDTPSTTSSTTYQVYSMDEGGNTPIYINRSADDGNALARGRGVSTITVMEIAQ